VRRLQRSGGAAAALPPAAVELSLGAPPPPAAASNMSKPQFLGMVAAAQEHIRAGDIFQVVLSQRFERRTFADPFEVYRALRVVNPSPYMIYLQARGAIFVASSPEILCRVTGDGTTTHGTPAATAALNPLCESSSTSASSGITPSAALAARNKSGHGFALATSSRVSTASNAPSNPVRASHLPT
jgi:hypothetical protein